MAFYTLNAGQIMFEALNNSAINSWLSQLLWGFPMAEIFHLLMLTTFFGGLVMLDLRLLGLNRFISSKVLMRHVLGCIWIAFAGVMLSGGILFLFMPLEYVNNPAFQIKLGLMVLGAVNAMWMHKALIVNIDDWDEETIPPLLVRLSALFSLLVWGGAVACGRLIAYYYGYAFY
jgi:hypothetical protein